MGVILIYILILDNILIPQLYGKLKDIKALLLLVTSRDLKVFSLCGQNSPNDFLALSLSIPSKLLPDTIEFEDSKFLQGQCAFNSLSDQVSFVQETYPELVEEHVDETSLKEKANNLYAVFNPDTTAQINHITSSRDYIRALFKYVHSVATLQLFYKSKHTTDSGGVSGEGSRSFVARKAVNPFLVLKEDISMTFGRLLFEWGMSPKRLESFAKQAGVNLIQVIAENCGVSVPSTSRHVSIQQKFFFKNQIVLNNSNPISEIELEKNPNSTVEELLNSVLEMISGK